MKRLVLFAVLLFAVATPIFASAQPVPAFKLGFKALADQVPSVAGLPLEEEHWGANGDSLQRTTTGLMVWRKADNWTAFTNGSRTWINGPRGVQSRPNDERFPWEAAAPMEAMPQPAQQGTGQPAPVISEKLILEVLSVTSPVRAGELANLSVTTVTGLAASFVINTASGPVRPDGRDARITDCSGKVSWTWPIDASMPAGTWPIVVTVDTGIDRVVKETSITILKP